MGTEVERKFLLSGLPPEVESAPGSQFRQGYLALEGETEVRVRLEAELARLTIKHGGGRVRLEEEIELDDRQAEALWPLTEGRRLEKVRRRVELDGLLLEVDQYGGDLAGLMVAEVEFPDDAAAVRWSPPSWLGREVTDDPAYKNRSLACKGIPRSAD
jgi:adenylate cyclase